MTKVSRSGEAAEIIDSAVRIVSRVSPRSTQREDQQYALGRVRGLASVATSIVLQSGKPASYVLELLETGCGVIAGLLLNFTSNISTLAKEHPDLCSTYKQPQNEVGLTVLIESTGAQGKLHCIHA